MLFGLPPLIAQWLRFDRVAELAERVAGRSRLAVWQRVMDRLPSLHPHEARGYLRARAVAIVCDETDCLVEQEGTKVARLRGTIEEAALQLLVHTMTAQLQSRRVVKSGRRAA
jgi:hypothetical protein